MPIIGTLPRIKQPITDISATTVINWLSGPIFSRTITANTAFTFTNESVGQAIQVVLFNNSANVVTANFSPASLNLHWEKGGVQNRVGAFQSTVFKFVNLGSFILASVVSERIRTETAIESDDFYMMDPSDIGYSLSKWTRVSGTGTMAYEASSDTGMGYGRFSFDGDCVYLFDTYISVMPYTGIGGYGRYKKSLNTATISMGGACYDANKNDLATYKNFVASNASVTTSWAISQGRAKLEGGSQDNLATGTRFIRPYIAITNYVGTTADKVYLSGFNIFTSNFATVSDYA